MTLPPLIPYRSSRYTPEEMLARAEALFAELDARRSVREFSDEQVPRRLIELAIATASTAPSGAHKQPWRFVAIDDPQLKRQIRVGAETEEHESYEGGRMPDEWREAVAPFRTTWQKPFLETAPWLVVVFEEAYGHDEQGERSKNYYVKESVGIACGMFIAALHHMGLVTLTHTPSPMHFLNEICARPENERPYILFPVGYPAAGAQVPDLRRKGLDEVAVWNPGREADK